MNFNTNNKLILLGTGYSIYSPDYNDKNFDIWGLGSCFSASQDDIKRIDLGFEIHNDEVVTNQIEKKLCDYNKFSCKVYVQNKFSPVIKKHFKNAVNFPLKQLLDFVAPVKDFDCSLSYMLVYAVMVGYREIYFHKALFAVGDDYVFEKPSIEYWIRVLKKQFPDLRIHLNNDCELFSEKYLYGFEDEPANYSRFASKIKYMWDRHNDKMADYLYELSKFNQIHGQLQFMQKIQGKTIEEIKDIYNNELKNNGLTGTEMRLRQKDKELNQIIGGLQATHFFEEYYK